MERYPFGYLFFVAYIIEKGWKNSSVECIIISGRSGIMTKFAYGYLLALPYINVAALLLLLKNEVDGVSLIIFFVVLALTCLIGAVMNVVYNLCAVTAESPKWYAVRNLILKISHLPVHLLVLMVVMGFMNPFLLLVSWVPALFGFGLLVFDACTNIGTCINLYRHKKCTLGKAVLFCLLSYVYIADLVGAAFQIKRSCSDVTGEMYEQF